jgi:ferrous iron transport protein B
MSLYAVGIIFAILTSLVLNKTVFKNASDQFVMELPPYRFPTVRNILVHMWDKSVLYLKKMATVILAASVLIWALGYFPRGNYETLQEQQENSYIGMIGKSIEPVLEPLGFDWRMGVGIVSGVGAKELVVSTLGVMYSGYEPDAAYSDLVARNDSDLAISSDGPDVGDDVGESAGDVSACEIEDAHDVIVRSSNDVAISSSGPNVSDPVGHVSLSEALKHSVTPAGALAYMVFILLYFPCVATFIAIRNETGSWKWAIFTAVYTIALAWVAAFATFHIAGIFFG